jgi:acyl dehydratase
LIRNLSIWMKPPRKSVYLLDWQPAVGTPAVAMRLLVEGGLPLGNGIIGLGGDLAWPKPTRPGDTLHVESEILEIAPSRSKPNQAIVKVRSVTLNQNGEPVHSFTSKCLVFKRPQPKA